MNDQNKGTTPLQPQPAGTEVVVTDAKTVNNVPQYKVEKITRSCDRKISKDFNTYGTSMTLSVSPIADYLTEQQIDAITADLYRICENNVVKDTKEVERALSGQNVKG